MGRKVVQFLDPDIQSGCECLLLVRDSFAGDAERIAEGEPHIFFPDPCRGLWRSFLLDGKSLKLEGGEIKAFPDMAADIIRKLLLD